MCVKLRCGAAVALLVAMGVVSSGCSGAKVGVSRAPGDARPVLASPSADPRLGGSAAALAAYRAMWEDLEDAGLTADPNSPRLGDHATGAALRLLKYGLSKDRRDHVVTKGSVVLSPEVESAAPTQVMVEDCTDSSHWLVYKSDGTLKDAVPGGHHDTRAVVRRFGHDWKVVALTMDQVGSC